MNASWQRYGTFIARLALAAIFIHSGFGKLTGLEATGGFIASKGLPAPMVLAAMAGALELIGGLALVAGFATRWAALALALFLVPTTFLFHNPSGLAGAAAQMQMIQVYKNLAIFGGLLSLASWGAGSLSLDARLGRPVAAPEESVAVRRAA